MRKRRNRKPKISDQQWNQVVSFYKDYTIQNPDRPPSHVEAEKSTGVNYRTCRKAFVEGWGVKYPAIKDMIEHAKVQARADMAEVVVKNAEEAALDEYRAKEKAKADLVQSRKQEAQIVRGERGNVLALINITGKGLRGMIDQADALERSIRSGVDLATGKKLTTRQRFVLLSRISHLVERCATAGAAVLKMERLLLGEPTEIVGHQIEGLTLDQARGKVLEANDMLNRIEARQERATSLKLIQGGKSNGTDSHSNGNGSA